MRTAIIGGGAAGFFAAATLKEMMPEMDVTIFERSHRVLAKVEISGGGRCNCTNTFAEVTDLSSVYPRGHRLLKRLFNVFGPEDAFRWFESHGVPLMVQYDQCVFPSSQDSRSIMECLINTVRRHGVAIKTKAKLDSITQLEGYGYAIVATGGSPHGKGLQRLEALGHDIASPVPSLFSLSVGDASLHKFMGTVCAESTVHIEGTKHRSSGALLITHWGLSGPAILRLSSYAARHLYDSNYKTILVVNWTGKTEGEVRDTLTSLQSSHPHKQLSSLPPLSIPRRLWEHFIEKSIGDKTDMIWHDIGKKDINRIVNTLVSDRVETTGRAPFHDEYVTCGGVSLSSIDSRTLESKVHKGMYFAGEVLDIDGVTGGFNFQAAWTTAYVAASSIASSAKSGIL